MNSLVLLFAFFVVAGFRKPGRMGSTHVSVLVASAVLLGWSFLRFGH
jgi:hypothetical protein